MKKNPLKLRSIIALLAMAALTTAAFSGCNKPANKNEESALSTPSEAVSEVTPVPDSSAEDGSETDTSEDASKTESSVDEKSEEESKVESSVDEKSEEESDVDSSIVESSPDASQIESTAESSISSEEVFNSIPYYDGDGIELTAEDIVCYGHSLVDIPLSESSSIPKGSLIAILGKSRAEGNVDIAIGWNFSLIAKINDIEFLPLDYINTSGEELYFPF